jgi:hypothetical protein
MLITTTLKFLLNESLELWNDVTLTMIIVLVPCMHDPYSTRYLFLLPFSFMVNSLSVN